jgi:hypothetical protein
MLTSSWISWFPGTGNDASAGKNRLNDDEELEEVTEVVRKNSWSDFLAYLSGRDQLDPGETEVTEEALRQTQLVHQADEQSFSRVMASIITGDNRGLESSENEDSPVKPPRK